MLIVLVPAAVLFAPLVLEQFRRGNPFALFAEPGLPVVGAPPGAHELAVGSLGGWAGWEALLAGTAVSALAPWVLAFLVAPIAALAVLALFVPGTRRSVPAMVIALLGYLTAVLAIHLQLAVIGSQTAAVWAGPGLSLYWLGLIGAGIVARRGARAPRGSPDAHHRARRAGRRGAAGARRARRPRSRCSPAAGDCSRRSRPRRRHPIPRLGTLELIAQPDGGIGVTVHRGSGTTLDELATIASTSTTPTEGSLELAELAGNIASRSGFDLAAALDRWHIAFVLVPVVSDPGADAVHQRITEALDGNRLLDPVGQTATGLLWNYPGLTGDPVAAGPGPTGTALGLWIVIAQAVVFGLALLMAIPTTRRRRVRSSRGGVAADDAVELARAAGRGW